MDPFTVIFALVALGVYGSICIIAIIFTFFSGTYKKIEDKLNVDLFPAPVILSMLERNVLTFNEWAQQNNKIVGSALILLSFIDLQGFLYMLSSL